MPRSITIPDGNLQKSSALTTPQAATLLALSRAAGMTSGRLSTVGASPSAAKELEQRRLVSREDLDIEGVKETVWRITPSGRAELAKSAPPSVGSNGKDDEMPIGGIVPWFGAARKSASNYSELLRGCEHVTVPFCGSLAEIPAMLDAKVSEIVASDMHSLLVNLARVMADNDLGPQLYRRLRRQPFTPKVLKDAQDVCKRNRLHNEAPHLDAAFNYFIAAWCGRSGNAGTENEFSGGLAMRYSGGGGCSALRFSGAAWSIRAWRKVLQRCTLLCEDAFDLIPKVKDRPRNGLYIDPPWPEAGDPYKISFDESCHKRLKDVLDRFKKARIVIRTGGDPLTRSLYPEKDGWVWREVDGRDQANARKAEYAVVLRGKNA